MEVDFEKNMTNFFSNKASNNRPNKTISLEEISFQCFKFERIQKEDITIST